MCYIKVKLFVFIGEFNDRKVIFERVETLEFVGYGNEIFLWKVEIAADDDLWNWFLPL